MAHGPPAFEKPEGLLEVTVVGATNVPRMDLLGKVRAAAGVGSACVGGLEGFEPYLIGFVGRCSSIVWLCWQLWSRRYLRASPPSVR